MPERDDVPLCADSGPPAEEEGQASRRAALHVERGELLLALGERVRARAALEQALKEDAACQPAMRLSAVRQAAMTPVAHPTSTSRPTSGSRTSPASTRTHDTSIAGQRRRTNGSTAT